MRQINIGLLGCGTVGTGVAKMILEKKELLTARVGADMNLQWVADIDTETDRGIRFDDGVFINDALKVVQDADDNRVLAYVLPG